MSTWFHYFLMKVKRFLLILSNCISIVPAFSPLVHLIDSSYAVASKGKWKKKHRVMLFRQVWSIVQTHASSNYELDPNPLLGSTLLGFNSMHATSFKTHPKAKTVPHILKYNDQIVTKLSKV